MRSGAPTGETLTSVTIGQLNLPGEGFLSTRFKGDPAQWLAYKLFADELSATAIIQLNKKGRVTPVLMPDVKRLFGTDADVPTFFRVAFDELRDLSDSDSLAQRALAMKGALGQLSQASIHAQLLPDGGDKTAAVHLVKLIKDARKGPLDAGLYGGIETLRLSLGLLTSLPFEDDFRIHPDEQGEVPAPVKRQVDGAAITAFRAMIWTFREETAGDKGKFIHLVSELARRTKTIDEGAEFGKVPLSHDFFEPIDRPQSVPAHDPTPLHLPGF